jgi:hypothetical protein
MFRDTQMNYNFTNISDIIKLPEDHFINLIAIVHNVAPKKMINNKEFREIVLVDDSMHSIVASLWGNACNLIQDDCKKGTIVLIKAGKTSYKYHGRAVMVGNYSEVKLNPEIEESSALNLWYQKKDFKNLINVAYNKCLLLDDGTVAIDEILDHAYDNNIPLI